MARDEEFIAYYTARVASVRNVAYLLCGNWHTAEDLTQTAFVKLYRAWSRVSTDGSLDRYLHRVLMRSYLDERRRPWRRESSVAPHDGVLERVEPSRATEEKLNMLAALNRVPPRQRAVLVLRFWLDLSVTDAAQILRCSEGTIKSQAARGLATLRTYLDPATPTGGRI